MSDTTYGLMGGVGLQIPSSGIGSPDDQGGGGVEFSVGPFVGLGAADPDDLKVGAQCYVSRASASTPSSDSLSSFSEFGVKFASVELWSALRFSPLWGYRVGALGSGREVQYAVLGFEAILKPFGAQDDLPGILRDFGIRLAYTGQVPANKGEVTSAGFGYFGSQVFF